MSVTLKTLLMYSLIIRLKKVSAKVSCNYIRGSQLLIRNWLTMRGWDKSSRYNGIFSWKISIPLLERIMLPFRSLIVRLFFNSSTVLLRDSRGDGVFLGFSFLIGTSREAEESSIGSYKDTTSARSRCVSTSLCSFPSSLRESARITQSFTRRPGSSCRRNCFSNTGINGSHASGLVITEPYAAAFDEILIRIRPVVWETDILLSDPIFQWLIGHHSSVGASIWPTLKGEMYFSLFVIRGRK